MATGRDLLQRTVEELKKVEFRYWRYKQDGYLSSYSHFSASMDVTVCCRKDELSRCCYMKVRDIAENKEATYSYVESLYHHLEAQRAKNESAQPTKNQQRRTLLLEQLLEELGHSSKSE